jgi:hypothetical protein
MVIPSITVTTLVGTQAVPVGVTVRVAVSVGVAELVSVTVAVGDAVKLG